MSWWERASPVQWARMSPRAKVLAGLSGYGLGNIGVEERTADGSRLLDLTTIQNVAMPREARRVSACQPMPELPRQIRGFGWFGDELVKDEGGDPLTTVEPAPRENTVTLTPEPAPASQMTQYVAPVAPISTPRVAQDAPIILSTQETAPMIKTQTEPQRFATGKAVDARDIELYPSGESATFTPPPPALLKKLSSPKPNLVAAMSTMGPLTPTLQPGWLGVPTWVWVVGGIGTALVVMYKMK